MSTSCPARDRTRQAHKNLMRALRGARSVDVHVLDRNRLTRGVGHDEPELISGGVVGAKHGLAIGAVLRPRAYDGVCSKECRNAVIVCAGQKSAPENAGRRAGRFKG